MSKVIRHRRLHAFYTSKVLNAMMILLICSLFIMYYTGKMLLPMICGGLTLLFFIGYSLWLWIKKPDKITINEYLSDYNGYLTLYFLIISALKNASGWWYIFPVVTSVMLFFIVMVKNYDSEFIIVEQRKSELDNEEE